jgi:uncharacterized Fe-S cluster-containing radical SAM superfamily protein
MKHTLLIFILSVFCSMAWGQGTVSRLTFISGGKAATNAGITVGEPILGRSNMVTLGSQQGSSYVTNSIDAIINKNQVSVFPNPFSESFNVTVKGEAESNFSLRIINLMGQEIFVKNNLQKAYTCNLQEFPQGTYCIIITDKQNQKIISKNLIKL